MTAKEPKVYRVEFTKKAAKELERLPEKVQRQIAPVVDGLANEPRPAGCEKLAGEDDLWRVRSGDYRLIYTVRDDLVIVTVVRIAHRKDVYRNL